MKRRVLPISIVIPAKNEGEGIAGIIKSLKIFTSDIIVVDGHSTDNTKEAVLKEKARFYLDSGEGRGAGVRLGIKKAQNNIIVLVDADGSHDIKDIPRLVKVLKENKADMVITSRRTGGSTDMKLNFDGLLRSVGSDILTMLVNFRFKTEFTDVLYSFRILRKDKFQKAKITATDFSIEQDMIISFLKKDFKVIEIPSRESARAWGVSKLKTTTGIKLFFKLLVSLYT